MLAEYLQLFITRLKNTFVYKRLLNNLFLVAFYILLVLLAINHHLMFLCIIAFSYYLLKKDKKIWVFSMILSLVVIISFIYLEITIKEETDNEFYGIVIDIEEEDTYQKILLRKKNSFKKIIIYDNLINKVKIGDVIKGAGIINDISERRIENGFDYKEYLLHKKIVKVINCDSFLVVNHRFNINYFRFVFVRYLNSFKSFDFLKAIIVGNDSDFTEDFQKAIKVNGISHLFAVSGLHIGILIIFLTKVLKLFRLNDNLIGKIISMILLVYIVITSFSPSVIRAVSMYYLSTINKKYKLALTSLDIVSLVFIILIVINPYNMYSLGFVLSFIMAFTIVLLSPLIASLKEYQKLIIISLVGSIVTLPIIININCEIGLLNPIFNALFIVLVSYVILPFSFLVVILKPLDIIFSYVKTAFSSLIVFFSKLNFSIALPKMSFLVIVIYYLLIIIFIIYYRKKKTYILSFVFSYMIFIIVLGNSNYLVRKSEIYFLDLYNGESIIINDNISNCHAVIDTGSGKNNAVTNFIMSKGIKELDFLLLTHNHIDHNGEASNLLSKVSVNKTITSAYDNSVFKNNVNVKKGDTINCGKLQFKVLHPDKMYDNENDNSIVLEVKLGGLNYLFLGDASKNIEEKLIEKRIITNNIDVVKISHHGSLSATSDILLEELKIKYAIIQVGEIGKKQFRFPNNKVISRLTNHNIIIYRTDLNYSIKVNYSQKKSRFIPMR